MKADASPAQPPGDRRVADIQGPVIVACSRAFEQQVELMKQKSQPKSVADADGLRRLDAPVVNLAGISEIERTFASLREIEKTFASLREIERAFASLREMEATFASLREIAATFASLREIDATFASLREIERNLTSVRQVASVLAGLSG